MFDARMLEIAVDLYAAAANQRKHIFQIRMCAIGWIMADVKAVILRMYIHFQCVRTAVQSVLNIFQRIVRPTLAT